MKRLNIVKQLKKTSKGKQFSKNFKGKVIDGLHELYTLTAGMMLGIRCSVSALNSYEFFNTLNDNCLVHVPLSR